MSLTPAKLERIGRDGFDPINKHLDHRRRYRKTQPPVPAFKEPESNRYQQAKNPSPMYYYKAEFPANRHADLVDEDEAKNEKVAYVHPDDH